jgi:hypothetical protein
LVANLIHSGSKNLFLLLNNKELCCLLVGDVFSIRASVLHNMYRIFLDIEITIFALNNRREYKTGAVGMDLQISLSARS